MDPTHRFSNRVADYIRYRPGYPAALLSDLQIYCSLTPDQIIADIGSGTGFLTQPFLDHGNWVYGVEPNAEMRSAAETRLQRYDHFQSVAGRAEATTLPDQSVDFIMAGQAFHWFNIPLTKLEFQRILRPQGWVILVWNDRLDTDPFQQAYEQFLLTYGIDYKAVNHRNIDQETIAHFFHPHSVQEAEFEHTQSFNFEGLVGRLMSCSYAPTVKHPSYPAMMQVLRQLFETYQHQGQLLFRYRTRLYRGHLSRPAVN